MDDTIASTSVAANTYTGSGSIVGSESSLPRYRPDYSRSQHPLPPSTRPSSSSERPFPSTMSPEQIRFERYINRFAVHDPRSSPVKRQKEPTDAPQQQLHSPPEILSVSERINRFNKGGGQPQHQQLPIPQQQRHHSASPLRTTNPPPKASQRSEGVERSSVEDQNRLTSSGYNRIIVVEGGSGWNPTTNQQEDYSAPELARPMPSNSSSSEYPTAPLTPKLTTSMSTTTTATNYTVSTAASGEPESMPNLDRRDVPPTQPSRFTPTRCVRPLVAEGQRSYSYDQPRSNATTSAIETSSPARVAELRKKLWDTNETLQVAVPPSLHYIGGLRDQSERSLVEEKGTSRSASKAVLPKGGPEMAGRFGQRSRSHSPKRPQYASSTFKSRYYEAALASRRAHAAKEMSPKIAAKRLSFPPKQNEPDRIELERWHSEVPTQTADVEPRNRNDDYNHNNETDELPKQDYGPQRGRQQQPRDYGPRKRYNLDSRDTESQRMQEHLESIMVNATTVAQQEQQKQQQQQQSAVTTSNGENAVSSMWRRQPMPSLVDERSDTTGEASVAKLVARLSSISRDNPAEALAQIDSILRAESKSSSGDMDHGRLQTPITSVQEEKKDDYECLEGDDSDDDDETSMSSITNPSYAHATLAHQNLPQLLTSGRNARPNSLQTYQQPPSAAEGKETKTRTKEKRRPTPPSTIQVKEPSGKRGVDQFMGRLDQLLTNDDNRESRNAAAIAMKIRMWDELSVSKSPSKMDEALSTVPSFQEEIISATTDELGSIVTPADCPTNGSVTSSHGESPLIMSCLPTPPSSLLMPGGGDSMDVSNEGSRQEFDVCNTQDQLYERGRQRSREDSPPPLDSSKKSLTPRRNHPWDHHHPRNRSESREPNPSYEDRTVDVGEGLEMRPIDPAPITSPRIVLSVPREADSQGLRRSPPRGQQPPMGSRNDVSNARSRSDGQAFGPVTAQVRGESEAPSHDLVSEVNHQTKLSLTKASSKQREPATPTNDKVGLAKKTRGFVGNEPRATVKLMDTSGGGDGWEASALRGHSFEVDPKLLKENDEFGFPIRVKQDDAQAPSFLDDFDPAWEPLTASTFFPTKNAKPSAAQQRLSQREATLRANGTLRDAATSMPIDAPAPNIVDDSDVMKQRGGDRRSKSPGRTRFSLLRMKKSHDSALHSPSFDNSKPIDGTSLKQGAARMSPGKRRDNIDRSKSPEKSKFSLLKLKKGREDFSNTGPPALQVDTAAMPQTQRRSVSKSPGPKGTVSPGPSRVSPGRDRTGSFNIVQRFNRLRRERENEN